MLGWSSSRQDTVRTFVTSASSFNFYDSGPVVQWSCALVSLSHRVGRLPSNRVCAAQDGCSQAKCLRHDSIMARGSAHTKHSIPRHSLEPIFTMATRPSIRHPRAQVPRGRTSWLILFISTAADSPVHIPDQLAWARGTQTSVSPVCACAAVRHRRCSTNPILPVHVLELTGLAACRLATSTS